MKPIIGVSIVVMAVLAISQAIGSNGPDRPAGIAANQWAPISETLGVVLVPESDQAAAPAAVAPIVDRTGLYAQPSAAVMALIEQGHPVRGYLMVKRDKFWRPLVVVPPSMGG